MSTPIAAQQLQKLPSDWIKVLSRPPLSSDVSQTLTAKMRQMVAAKPLGDRKVDEPVYKAIIESYPTLFYRSSTVEANDKYTIIHSFGTDTILIYETERDPQSGVLLVAELVQQQLKYTPREPKDVRPAEIMFYSRPQLLGELHKALLNDPKLLEELRKTEYSDANQFNVVFGAFNLLKAILLFKQTGCEEAIKNYINNYTGEMSKGYRVTPNVMGSVYPAIPFLDGQGHGILATDQIMGRVHLMLYYDKDKPQCAVKRNGLVLSFDINKAKP